MRMIPTQYRRDTDVIPTLVPALTNLVFKVSFTEFWQGSRMSDPPAFAEKPLSLFSSDEAPATQLPNGRTPSYIADHRKRLRARFLWIREGELEYSRTMARVWWRASRTEAM